MLKSVKLNHLFLIFSHLIQNADPLSPGDTNFWFYPYILWPETVARPALPVPPLLVMWPTNFCDNLLQTETRLWEIFILVMLSMRYKFLKRNSIQLLVLFNSYR